MSNKPQGAPLNSDNEGGCIHLLLLPFYLVIAILLAPGIIVDTLRPGYFDRGFRGLLGIIGLSMVVWGTLATLVALFAGAFTAAVTLPF